MASADGGGGGGYSSADVGLAFGLVLGAGFSTDAGCADGALHTHAPVDPPLISEEKDAQSGFHASGWRQFRRRVTNLARHAVRSSSRR